MRVGQQEVEVGIDDYRQGSGVVSVVEGSVHSHVRLVHQTNDALIHKSPVLVVPHVVYRSDQVLHYRVRGTQRQHVILRKRSGYGVSDCISLEVASYLNDSNRDMHVAATMRRCHVWNHQVS